MLQIVDYNNIFTYLIQEYGIQGIHINIINPHNPFPNIWNLEEYIEESNYTFVFRNLETFQNGISILRDTHTQIEFIRFQARYISFKYYVRLNKLVFTTEIFNDISVIQNIITQSNIKDVLYSLRNNN